MSLFGKILEKLGLRKPEAPAAANPQKLNWKVSIVDLLKLLGLDSSLAARKELAANGGNIPRDLLD